MDLKACGQGGCGEGVPGAHLVSIPSLTLEPPASTTEPPTQCGLANFFTHRDLVTTQSLGAGAEASLQGMVLTPGHTCGWG
jgi:hypothetical protein